MSVLLADRLDDDETLHAYRALRSARRRNRVESLDFFDAFYKAYVTALVAAVSIYAAAGAFGDDRLTPSQLHDLRVDGPAWAGLLVAFAVAVGVRSGGRGGPMAFERADVRHLLMAPVDRRWSIRAPFLRRLRYSAFLGVCIGGAAGLVASRRMPEPAVEWVGCGALFGAGVAVVAFSSAAVAAGHRIKVWMADVIGAAVMVWSVIDLWFELETSPLTHLGGVVAWPLRFDPLGAIGFVLALALAAWATGVVNRSSIELAEVRSRLVGQLRFAATLQDIRTVMVLQRQLSQEQIRQRPWIRLPRSKRSGHAKGRVHRRVFLKRGLHGLLRWPALRIVRLFFFAAVAGFSGLGVWAGTSPLIVVGGVALWLAALDLCEPLAQEIDHPDRLRASAQQTGTIYLQHVFIPFAVMIVLTLLAFVPAFVIGDAHLAAALLPLSVFTAGTAVAGATLAVNAKPPGEVHLVETPETASPKFVWRVLVPPALGVAGFLPLCAAAHSWHRHHDQQQMIQAANPTTIFCMAVIALALGWLRFGEQFRESLNSQAVQAAKEAEKRKAAKASPTPDDAEDREEEGSGKRDHAHVEAREAARARNKATQNKRKKR